MLNWHLISVDSAGRETPLWLGRLHRCDSDRAIRAGFVQAGIGYYVSNIVSTKLIFRQHRHPQVVKEVVCVLVAFICQELYPLADCLEQPFVAHIHGQSLHATSSKVCRVSLNLGCVTRRGPASISLLPKYNERYRQALSRHNLRLASSQRPADELRRRVGRRSHVRVSPLTMCRYLAVSALCHATAIAGPRKPHGYSSYSLSTSFPGYCPLGVSTATGARREVRYASVA